MYKISEVPKNEFNGGLKKKILMIGLYEFLFALALTVLVLIVDYKTISVVISFQYFKSIQIIEPFFLKELNEILLIILLIPFFTAITNVIYFQSFNLDLEIKIIKQKFKSKELVISTVCFIGLIVFIFFILDMKVMPILVKYIILLLLLGISLYFQMKYLYKNVRKKIFFIILGLSIMFTFINSILMNNTLINFISILLILLGYMLSFMLLSFLIWMIWRTIIADYRSAENEKNKLLRKIYINNLLDGRANYFSKLKYQLKQDIGRDDFFRICINRLLDIRDQSYFDKISIIRKLMHLNTDEQYYYKKAFYLDYRNRSNFYLALLLVINFLILAILVIPVFPTKEKEILFVLLFFIFARLLGRTVEISKAFYQDVISKEPKSSALTNAERIKLAIISIAEMAITSSIFYTAYYYFSVGDESVLYIDNLFSKDHMVHAYQVINDSMLMLKKGVAVSFFNISFENGNFTSFVHLLQLLNSIVLITISIANYLGMEKSRTYFTVEFENDKYHLIENIVPTSIEILKKKYLSDKNLEGLEEQTKNQWSTGNINEQDLSKILYTIKRKRENINNIKNNMNPLIKREMESICKSYSS